ncbi:MAG: acyl carrier protein [Eubacterium sp.]|nr:acyl carrier protein [Eubacterium sp.]
METREQIIDILSEIDDSIDYENEDRLVDDHLLDSFGIISLVAELEDNFDIQIGAEEMIPENFNSVDALAAMVERLAE